MRLVAAEASSTPMDATFKYLPVSSVVSTGKGKEKRKLLFDSEVLVSNTNTQRRGLTRARFFFSWRRDENPSRESPGSPTGARLRTSTCASCVVCCVWLYSIFYESPT